MALWRAGLLMLAGASPGGRTAALAAAQTRIRCGSCVRRPRRSRRWRSWAGRFSSTRAFLVGPARPARPATARSMPTGPRRRAGDARRPESVAPGRARRAVADVSRAPAEFQHRPRQRGERERQPGAAGRARVRRAARDRRPRRLPRRPRPTSCRRAGCSGTAAPTRCRTRRSARCSTRWRWTAAASRGRREAAPRALCAALRRSCSARRSSTIRGSLVAEALFAVARYQIEEPSFHPYTSKFDYWLEGKARLSPAELRGYALFNDPHKANCGGCHLDQPTPRRLAAAVHRPSVRSARRAAQPALAANRDPALFRSRHLRAVSHRHARSRRSIAGCS